MIKVRGVGAPVRFVSKHFGGNKVCAVCKSRVAMWVPHSDALRTPLLMKHLEVVGSDAWNFGCPVCVCHDRIRHLFLYFDATGFLPRYVEGKAVLHFAPEPHIVERIIASSPRRYVRADLHPSAPEIQRIDMQTIPFEEASFDLVIANHVLEHVEDDRLGLREIARVLRPGGVALLQTPFSNKLTRTLDDTGIDTDVLRIQLCGQADHLRLYGRDIAERFAECGLVPHVRQHRELLAGFDPLTYGVAEQEPFMVFEKPGAEPS